ncbi:MAG: CBS domain-containing protein [Planctomycetota bacterium]|jgi:CBS domain-containing protein
MPGHKHLVPGGTFMGNPWTKSEEKIGLAADTELAIVTFEMTIDPLPAFKCAVIYPKSLFAPSQEAGSDAEAAAKETSEEQAASQEAPDEEEQTDQPAAEGSADKEPATEPAAEKVTAEAATEEAAAPEAAAEEPDTEPAAEEEPPTEPATEEAAKEEPSGAESGAEQAQPEDEQKVAAGEPEQAQTGPVTDAIAKMKESPAVLPGQFADCAAILTELAAKDVMTTNVVWAGPDETVEQLTAKMQQHDTAYLLIGEKEQLQGIVSKSDIRGAQSPYLRSMFAKWRTSMDIATLQIKAQWVMSRPVRTVRPDVTLAQVMQAMTEHGGRCMPVTDEAGKVQGIVTVFDIFSALLVSGQGASTAGKTAQTPPVA